MSRRRRAGFEDIDVGLKLRHPVDGGAKQAALLGADPASGEHQRDKLRSLRERAPYDLHVGERYRYDAHSRAVLGPCVHCATRRRQHQKMSAARRAEREDPPWSCGTSGHRRSRSWNFCTSPLPSARRARNTPWRRRPLTGNEMFERYFRVQMNTLEQLIVFIPSILLVRALHRAAHRSGARRRVRDRAGLVFSQLRRDPKKRTSALA